MSPHAWMRVLVVSQSIISASYRGCECHHVLFVRLLLAHKNILPLVPNITCCSCEELNMLARRRHGLVIVGVLCWLICVLCVCARECLLECLCTHSCGFALVHLCAARLKRMSLFFFAYADDAANDIDCAVQWMRWQCSGRNATGKRAQSAIVV